MISTTLFTLESFPTWENLSLSNLVRFLSLYYYRFNDSALTNSILSIILILIIPVVFMILLPPFVKNKLLKSNKTICFSLGTLLGEFFCHLLPELFSSALNGVSTDLHSHGHNHEGHSHQQDTIKDQVLQVVQQPSENVSLYVGIWCLTGFLVFYFMDKLLAHFMENKDGNSDTETHAGHSHSHAHANEKEEVNTTDSNKWSVIYLNILSDFGHCLSDGVLLYSTFGNSKLLGISTTLAILVHEIPHVMGDYALLKQKAGLSFIQCFKQQFLSSFGSFIGVFIGWIVQNNNGGILTINFSELGIKTTNSFLSLGLQELTSEQILLSLTCGTLFYIICTNILPEINKPKTIKDLFLQIFAVALGFMTLNLF
ncbi:uncharacterized protein SCODWIG_01108 [Saccharomycodes ludwigii]|uniref:Zinc transporter YKE4 n=1 Tax=Saccharomycodes ludwigii TaxID=36035 RepID=A0A376B3V0_9ASCO|nr:uncharacterized protein SCODWIG_01108 [Saccharomycodes ludwigii]